MNYQMIVLDLDGTLTNSEKKITEPTRKALIEIQEEGKQVVLASGRPINGVLPIANELDLHEYDSYVLSFNGGRITQCSTGRVIYDKKLPGDVTAPTFEIISQIPGLDIVTYTDEHILSGLVPNEYTELESRINHMPILQAEHFLQAVNFPLNKLLITGEPKLILTAEAELKRKFHSLLNIYRSEPFFLEVMPQNVDKAYSLQRLLNSLGLTSNEMICCGDGYNDVTMIESAGLGVAMANAQALVKERADFITKSNDEDGILHVINTFMRGQVPK